VVLELAAGLVVAHVRIADVEPEILHVAEKMTLGVLRAEPAEPGAEAEIRDRLLLARHPLDRQPAQQNKAASLQQFIQDFPQERTEVGQGEARRTQGLKTLPRARKYPNRGIDLVELARSERPDPVVAACELAAVPHTGSGDRVIIHARRIA